MTASRCVRANASLGSSFRAGLAVPVLAMVLLPVPTLASGLAGENTEAGSPSTRAGQAEHATAPSGPPRPEVARPRSASSRIVDPECLKESLSLQPGLGLPAYEVLVASFVIDADGTVGSFATNFGASEPWAIKAIEAAVRACEWLPARNAEGIAIRSGFRLVLREWVSASRRPFGERWLIVDFRGGILGWGFLAVMAAATVSTFWFIVIRGFVRMKVRDPEWRRLADVWSWIGVGLGTAAVVAMCALMVVIIAVNTIWYTTH